MADLFDKITDGINKGVASVGVGSKALVGKAKIKTVINNYEKGRKHNAELLGMLVYERFVESGQAPDDEDMATLFTEISNCLNGIAQQQEELKIIEEEAAQLAGQKITTISSPQGTPAVGANKVCSCGFGNETSAKFCASCGSPL